MSKSRPTGLAELPEFRFADFFSFYVDMCDCKNKKMIPWVLEGVLFDLFDHDIQNKQIRRPGPCANLHSKNKNDSFFSLLTYPASYYGNILLCVISQRVKC